MKNHLFSLLIALICVLSPSLQAQKAAQNVRPGTILLSAFQTVNEAERLEEQKKHKAAWNKYHQALRYYKSLAAAHPEWKPHIIKRRVNTTKEAIARVEPMAQKSFMEQQAKMQNFVGQDGDPAALKAQAQTPTNQADLKQLTRLNNTINAQQRELETLKNIHTAEKSKLRKEIGKLQTELRKTSLGLGQESTQTKMLNAEIAKLQQKLRHSQLLGSKDQQKLMATIEELQSTRTKLATAPLRQDVEKLQRQKDRQERELRLLASEQIRAKKALEIKTLESQRQQQELKLTKQQLAEKTQQLEDSQNNTKSVVKAMRKEIRTLKNQLQTAEEMIANQKHEINGLINRLAESEAVTDELRQDLVNMTAERDQLSEMLQLSDADRAKQLMRENLRLGKALSEAKQDVAQLHADKNAALDRVLEAETKLAYAKQQVINSNQENASFRKRVSNLETSLKDTQALLVQKDTQAATDPAAREEAELLKKTVKRLIAQSSRRSQAERLLWLEYRKSANADPNLVEKYSELSNSDIQLTAKERKMLNTQQSDGTFISPHSRASQQTRLKAQAKADGQIESFHDVAKRFIEKENFDIARDIYDQAYETIPDYSFLINRGVVRMHLGELSDAEEIFELGASQRPRNPYTHFMLGLSRFEMGDDDLAAKSMDQALNLQPDHKVAMLYRGLIEENSGRYNKALEFLDKAIQIDPDFSMAHFNKAVLHNKMGAKEKARKAYNDALRAGLAPNHKFEKRIGINKSS